MSLPVLITRPGEGGERLCRRLEEAGLVAERLSLMALDALPETDEQRRVWLDVDLYRKVIVTSPFAVQCFSAALERYWPQLPVGIEYYALGESSAQALQARLGVKARVPVPDREGAGKGNTSESLLALPSLQVLDQQRVLIAAGEGGRRLLADTLDQRGARVTRMALYRRILHPPTPTMHERLASGHYAALVVTSGELLTYLADYCSNAATRQPLIVSSRRLAELAESLGFRTPVVAPGATPEALVHTLAAVVAPSGADVDQGT